MASTPEGTDLTERHRLQQIAIRTEFLRQFVPTWALLDFKRLDETSPEWLKMAMDLVRTYRLESANAAQAYFDRYRQVEVPNVSTSPPRLQIVHSPDVTGARAPDVVQSRGRRGNLDFSQAKPAVLDFGDKDNHVARSLHSSGPAYLKHLTKRGEAEGPAKLKAIVTVSGTAGRQVLNGGRDALEELVDADPVALGWARVTDGDPCAFCAMLASRGPVYKTEASAAFKPHDHCACLPEPVYSRSAAWTPGSRELRQLWLASTKGFSGQDAINAFRRAYARQRKADVTQPAALLA